MLLYNTTVIKAVRKSIQRSPEENREFAYIYVVFLCSIKEMKRDIDKCKFMGIANIGLNEVRLQLLGHVLRKKKGRVMREEYDFTIREKRKREVKFVV